MMVLNLPGPHRWTQGRMVLNTLTPLHARQMPQGGIDEDEDPYKVALRELHEETILLLCKVGEIWRMARPMTFRAVLRRSVGGKHRGRSKNGMRCNLPAMTGRDRCRSSRRRAQSEFVERRECNARNCRTWWCRSSAKLTNVSRRNSTVRTLARVDRRARRDGGRLP